MKASTTRRDVIKSAATFTAACGAFTFFAVRPSAATPETMQAAIRKVVGNAEVGKGKIKLDIPPLVENGNTVALSISVDSPMTPANYVKAIHIFNERNPQPNVIGIYLGPRAGKADIATRIRLSDTQKVVAIAELSDGSFWSETVDVIVTLAACLEGTL